MKIISLLLIMSVVACSSGTPDTQNKESEHSSTSQTDSTLYAGISMELLEAVKEGERTQSITSRLANVSRDELDQSLNTEGERKAFWLNVYNAYVQIMLKKNPELLKTRNDYFGFNFFSSPQVTIAGHELSFDDIEHGIIRHSKMKLSWGYLNTWFVDSFEKTFRWKKVDPRVHFALNCGAKSCPQIAIYKPKKVDKQLDITTKQYLKRTTEYDRKNDVVRVVSLFSWFRADFGGVSEGVPAFLKKYKIIPQDANPTVEFKDYDWTVDLGNYKNI